MQFLDRADAGRRLAERLVALDLVDPVVLALPRGGVPVALPIAEALGAPLEVFVARKIGAPAQPELGIGAVAEGLDSAVVAPVSLRLGVGQRELAELARRERAEVERRRRRYRGDRALPRMVGRTVVLVDDGLATGVTAAAALYALRARGPGRLLLAVPVCSSEAAAQLETIADQVVCELCPPELLAVGAWYQDFSQISDAEVLELLARGRAPAEPRG